MSRIIAPQWVNRRLRGEGRDRKFARRLVRGVTPWSLPDCVLWLVSDDLSDDLSDTATVRGWPARIGHSVGSNKNTSASFHTNELNGFPSVRVSSAAADVLIGRGETIASDSTPTAFIVCKPGATTLSDYVLSIGNKNVNGNVWGVSPEVSIRVVGGFTVFTTAMSTSAYSLLTVRMTGTNGNTGEAWINGSALTVDTTSSQATAYRHQVTLGGNFNGGSYDDDTTQMDYTEIIVVDSQLSDTKRAAVESYLMGKYGLS